MKRQLFYGAGLIGLAAAFALGRVTAPMALLDRADPSGARTVSYAGGALGADDVRPAVGAVADPAQRRAAVEQLVRTRLLALDAEAAGLHRSPEFRNSSPHPVVI